MCVCIHYDSIVCVWNNYDVITYEYVCTENDVYTYKYDVYT